MTTYDLDNGCSERHDLRRRTIERACEGDIIDQPTCELMHVCNHLLAAIEKRMHFNSLPYDCIPDMKRQANDDQINQAVRYLFHSTTKFRMLNSNG